MKAAFKALRREFKDRTMGDPPKTRWPLTEEEREMRRAKRKAREYDEGGSDGYYTSGSKNDENNDEDGGDGDENGDDDNDEGDEDRSDDASESD